MRTRRLAFGLVAPVALLLLVVALGTLQYRWVGQVSEAERAQLRESLDRRVQEFSEEFDRELGRAFRAFQIADLDPGAPEPFAKKYDDWQSTARYPAIVRTAYVARTKDRALELFRYSPAARTFDPIAWPESLGKIRERLTPRLQTFNTPVPAASTFVMATATTVVPEVPAIVVPLPHRAAPPSLDLSATPGNPLTGVLFAFHLDADSVILELDRAYIQDTVVPALVSRHFPEGDRYRVSILDAQSSPVYQRGDRAIDSQSADASAAFFTLRVDAMRDTTSLRMPPRAGGAGARVSGRATVSAAPAGGLQNKTVVVEQRASTMETMRLSASPGWRLLVQHSAGSLNAAVAQARRRNLWLSFGILAVLAASVGLIMINARRSERLAAQQMDFVATVSHELRTPLAVIRSAAQNLSAGVVHEPEQASRYGDLIESEGRRLTDMVEQVLEYAGLSGNRRPVRAAPLDCGSLAADVLASCRALAEADGVETALDVAPATPPVLADEAALRRALNNLLSNALKYAADGRWVGVSVRGVSARGQREVQIAVSDRGRGIAPEDIAHIFEPFYRGRSALERQIHGNGLGLSLVKRIAEAHGGRVSVKSTAGEGSTFTIHLPAAEADPAMTTLPEPAHDASSRA